MVKNVKPGYVNPLEMMKKGGQTNRLGLGGMKTAEKKRKALETEAIRLMIITAASIMMPPRIFCTHSWTENFAMYSIKLHVKNRSLSFCGSLPVIAKPPCCI